MYCTKDLDSLALRIHGVFGLAKKKAVRAKRLENKDTKTQVKRGRNIFWDDKDVVEEVEEVKFSGNSRSATTRKWNISDVMEEVHVSDDDFVPEKKQESGKKPKVKKAKEKKDIARLVASWNEIEEVEVEDSCFSV
jgi:hypothetical protein